MADDIGKKGKPVSESEKDRIIDQLRTESIRQAEAKRAEHSAPLVTKRKTLTEYIHQDSTHTSLLQVASASYNNEINKFDKSFSTSDEV
tara:strand:- start:145 stop:411 length:267 start_codon:yes stop_codon:yes gene_type:complete